MRLKTWLVAALGLGSLVVLIAGSMLASSRRAQEIYVQLDELSADHRRTNTARASTVLSRRDDQLHPAQIAVSAVGDELRVRVSDDGRGLDPGQRWKSLGLRGID